MKTRLALYNEGATTPESKNALARTLRAAQEIHRLKVTGTPPAVLDKLRAEALTAIGSDLRQESAQGLLVLKTRTNDLQARQAKLERENSGETRRYREDFGYRVAAMSNAELLRVTADFKPGNDPAIADIGVAEMRRRGIGEAEGLRENLLAKNYHEPWRHTTEGRALTSELKARTDALNSEGFILNFNNADGKSAHLVGSIQNAFEDFSEAIQNGE